MPKNNVPSKISFALGHRETEIVLGPRTGDEAASGTPATLGPVPNSPALVAQLYTQKADEAAAAGDSDRAARLKRRAHEVLTAAVENPSENG